MKISLSLINILDDVLNVHTCRRFRDKITCAKMMMDEEAMLGKSLWIEKLM